MLLRSGRAVDDVGRAPPTKADGAKQGKRPRVRATECNTQATASIFRLPREILHLIIFNLGEADALAVSNTCKQLAQICNGSENDSSVDGFWALYCKRRGLPTAPLTILQPTIRVLLHHTINNTCTSHRHAHNGPHTEVKFNTCPDGVRRRICWYCYDELLEEMIPARSIYCIMDEPGMEADADECDCYNCAEAEGEEALPWEEDPRYLDRTRREAVLRKALALEHLELRTDSKLCDDYVEYDEEDGGDVPFLADVVRTMVRMHILYEHSCMQDILNYLYRTQHRAHERLSDRKRRAEVLAEEAYEEALEHGHLATRSCPCGRPMLRDVACKIWGSYPPFDHEENLMTEAQARYNEQDAYWSEEEEYSREDEEYH